MIFRIALVTIFYNDKNSLLRCLNSFNEGVDLMICIDGKYPTFPDNNKTGLSIDGSREVVKSFKKAILVDMPNTPEFDKRQKYLQVCEENDVDILIIGDSDEYVLEDISNFQVFKEMLTRIIIQRDKGSKNVYAVPIRQPNGTYIAYPRVWYRPEEMEYYDGRHYFFRNKYPKDHKLYKENLPHQANHSVNTINGILLGHDHILRTPEHMASRFQYQVWLERHERNLPVSS
jgi:hypothetical protein